MLFHHRPENKSQKQRSRFAFEPKQHITDNTEDNQHPDIEHRIGKAVDAETGNHDDGGKKKGIREGQKSYPNPDKWQIEYDQHEVTNPHGCDQTPKKSRLL